MTKKQFTIMIILMIGWAVLLVMAVKGAKSKTSVAESNHWKLDRIELKVDSILTIVKDSSATDE